MRNKVYEENLIHTTLKGELVRSRAEVIIANILHEMRICYEYEKEFKGKDGRVASPDFTILYMEGKILIEYLGMLTDATYVEKNRAKFNWYQRQEVQLIQDYNLKGIKKGNIVIPIMEPKEKSIDSHSIARGLTDVFIRLDPSLLDKDEHLQMTKMLVHELFGINKKPPPKEKLPEELEEEARLLEGDYLVSMIVLKLKKEEMKQQYIQGRERLRNRIRNDGRFGEDDIEYLLSCPKSVWDKLFPPPNKDLFA